MVKQKVGIGRSEEGVEAVPAAVRGDEGSRGEPTNIFPCQ